MSILNKYRFLEEAYPDMLKGIGVLIQKKKLSIRFSALELEANDIAELEKAKELCELRIVQLWEDQSSAEFKALCATYFDIASLVSHDTSDEYYTFEQIKLITFGYLGEHWHFVRQYLKSENFERSNVENQKWNQHILETFYMALRHLVIKESWRDIDITVKSINELREIQGKFEGSFLKEIDENARPYGAAELVALYHLVKSLDVLAQFVLEGKPANPDTPITYHLDKAHEFCLASGNLTLDLLLKLFKALSLKLYRNTIWYSTSGVNNWVTKFNRLVTTQERGVFELLYPQRESIISGELLNPAHKAIIVNLPTSSGKTMIAEYRILQALNLFKNANGWVAYVVPTKALVNQVYVQLVKDLGGLGLKVEKASGAIELDGFEQHLIEEGAGQADFDILVTTYEKLNLLVRQGLGTKATKPLILTVVDEAHNIEEKLRGLNLELMLTTIKNDCDQANFLLMTPDISNSKELAQWLAGERGKEIRLELDWWQPNERVVGAIEVTGAKRAYDISLRTLHTDKATYEVGDAIPLATIEEGALTKSALCNSKVKISSCISGLMLDISSPIIVLAAEISETYTIAEHLYTQSVNFDVDSDVELLIKLVKSELGEQFPLAKFLQRRIAVHSSALPDEIKYLIEDLMAQEKLQALVATTTIAQGINFPVSAVILGSYNYPFVGQMPVRDFWNLAGRVGRAGQKSMGWVGLSVRNETDLADVAKYVSKASDALQSQLLSALQTAIEHADQDFSRWLWYDERWSAVLQYISHLRVQSSQREAFLAQLEQNLQSTLGYQQLSRESKNFFKEHIRRYAQSLELVDAQRADATGFSTVSVNQMIGRLSGAKLSQRDWNKDQLFSSQNQSMQKLIGVMMETYEIRKSINELSSGANTFDRSAISKLVIEWVNGSDIHNIAKRFFPDMSDEKAIQNATKALYKVIANAATWGLAALQKLPSSGIKWDSLSEIEKKKMANLPAYLHYGVNTDEGVLMRKNNVPRSIANKMGGIFNSAVKGEIFSQSSTVVHEWIGSQSDAVWDRVKPANSPLTGSEYKQVWKKLNGLD